MIWQAVELHITAHYASHWGKRYKCNVESTDGANTVQSTLLHRWCRSIAGSGVGDSHADRLYRHWEIVHFLNEGDAQRGTEKDLEEPFFTIQTYDRTEK